MPADKPNTALLWVARVLALAAFGLSGYLLYASLTTSDAVGCGFGGFDCEAVLGSPWSKWFGVPVAAMGALCYALAVVALVMIGGATTAAWRLLEFVVPAALGAAVWFIGVQFFALGEFCVYCLATHACGVVLSVIVLWLRRQSAGAAAPNTAALFGAAAPEAPSSAPFRPAPPPALGAPTAVGVVAVAALIIGQALGGGEQQVVVSVSELPSEFRFNETVSESEPDTVAAEEEREGNPERLESSEPEKTRPTAAELRRRRNGSRRVELLQGRFVIDTYKQAILGSPDAKHIVVEMMDYSCPHCREFHERLTAAIDRFDGEVAVVVLPTPGELLCNPYVRKPNPKNRGACRIARLALAVAELSPENFEEFHHYLMEGEKMPEITAALIEARKLVDSGDLSIALQGEEVDRRVKNNVELMGALYKANARFGLPSQILGDQVVIGPTKNVDELVEHWTKAFELDRPEVELPF